MFALKNLPRDKDGNIRAFTAEEARAIVENMVTTPTPLNERAVAPAATAESTAPRTSIGANEPVDPKALPEGMKLAPGDSGQFPEFDIPTGFNPDPENENMIINPENRRRTMFRRDM